MHCRLRATFLGIAAVAAVLQAAPFQELLPKYSRAKSLVMARSIEQPTRANLDYAAYTANPIRFDAEKQKPKRPANPVTISDMTFNGALANAVATIGETPLTETEAAAPLSWAPLMNQLWTEQKADGLKKLGAAIIGEKWGDPDIFKPYQDIAALYLHETSAGVEYWVRIEFMPWVTFLKGIGDADKDGFQEVYGLLSTGSIDPGQLHNAVAWIRNDYAKKVLTREEIVDWANVLASYWYPTLNTDIVNLGDATSWPVSETEKKVKKALKGSTFENPVAVIRGNPYGKVLYNVFLVPAATAVARRDETTGNAPAAKAPGTRDTAVSANFTENNARFKAELASFGDYTAWSKAVAPVHDGFRRVLATLPKDQMGIEGSGGWLFFRKSVDYILAPDLSLQKPEKNPLPPIQEFKEYCDRHGVNFLFIAVPCKEELYHEKLGIASPVPIVAPYGRKVLADLQKNGVEVIDLLPPFIEAKASDTLSTEAVYQKQDTHWSNRGLQIASQKIADRIKHYSWYDSTADGRIAFGAKDTFCLRQGDIVERIPEAARIRYPADTLAARQILTPEGKKYKSDPAGPILLIGDSFTGVFELVDCKSAGVGANIAERTGLPLDILTSWGGGPMIMNKAVRLRDKTMNQKRLVIFMMTCRDLFDYAQGWESLKAEQ